MYYYFHHGLILKNNKKVTTIFFFECVIIKDRKFIFVKNVFLSFGFTEIETHIGYEIIVTVHSDHLSVIDFYIFFSIFFNF